MQDSVLQIRWKGKEMAEAADVMIEFWAMGRGRSDIACGDELGRRCWFLEGYILAGGLPNKASRSDFLRRLSRYTVGPFYRGLDEWKRSGCFSVVLKVLRTTGMIDTMRRAEVAVRARLDRVEQRDIG